MLFLYSTLATGRLVPTTSTKTFNSMHRLADFAFIPPSTDSAGDLDEVRVLLLRTVVFFFSRCTPCLFMKFIDILFNKIINELLYQLEYVLHDL